ncbi:hypothetical protein [Dyadobacter luticola]|uniref:Lipoprotein n=1 Tax=Dyadobacter luticola TaxID=1979387 RepID=A0A5R9KS28_9BACT|nr:hypothetical protein [Dyadobacter luticola]TLU99085.1 hypothetical protein FEN17_21140 [Dyadobacter luticola]
MKYCIFIFLLTFAACQQKSDQKQEGDSGYTVINDTIPLTREKVQAGPVAAYSEKVKDPYNDWRFAVEVFETGQTFTYLMKIKYMELDAEDTLKIPNFGIMPKVEIQKGPAEQSCIVGFLDKKGVFKEYKSVAVEDKQLKIKTLRHYARTRYKVKK